MQTITIDFASYSSIKIGQKQTLSLIQSPSDYYTLCQSAPPRIIGGAYNLLISPQAKNLARLDWNYDYILDRGDCIEVGGATPAKKLFSFAKRHNLGGFEFLSHLPGTLGGIIKMNAGLKEYEIKSMLLGIKMLSTNGGLQFVPLQDLGLSYRSSKINSVIFCGIFKKQQGFNQALVGMFKAMRNNQPKEPSFGSCFQNPPNHYAGQLIESVGLKGVRFGAQKSLCFSPKHANFMINLGGASFEDALNLISLAKERVFGQFGIELKEEVQILH